jgi:hypothetical protein
VKGEDGIAPNGPVMTHARLVAELREKSRNAAQRGKPTMWAYYGDMADALEAEFADATSTDGGYAGCALAISQNAEAACPSLPRAEAARQWAISVYARRILAAWGAGIGNPVSLQWMRDRVEQEVAS